MVYLVECETPDPFENAFLDLDERETGMTGAVGGSSTCVLGRFWKSNPHPAPGLSGSGLVGRGERLVLRIFGSVRNHDISSEPKANMTHCAGEALKGMKPGGGSETTVGGDCTGGVLTLGNGRLCASSALSIPCSLVVTPGILDDSEKVFEVGRDCY